GPWITICRRLRGWRGSTAATLCGVIGHTLKFCDPYLARLPMIRDTLREAGLPLLLLEGDCSLRSIGQQRTRIEAFIEMLR
nr:2-hydroxyacyl-CoA dehydratase [Desulfobacterales bacterium]